jgi:hypothetical protein
MAAELSIFPRVSNTVLTKPGLELRADEKGTIVLVILL